MTNLASALTKYYAKTNQKIAFTNGMSLNKLAQTMRAKLSFAQIDASVISRVLKGERLFTPKQLQIFCEVLNISQNDEEFLFHNLSQDYYSRDNVTIDSFFVSTFDMFDILQKLVNNTNTLLYEGKAAQLIRESMLIESIVDKISTGKPTPALEKKVYEQLGLALYLRGRGISVTQTPDTAIQAAAPIVNQLLAISGKYKLGNIYAHAQVLLSDVHYVAGAYSFEKEKQPYFKKSIEYAKKAIDVLDDTSHVKLLAMRNAVASAYYLRDYETISHVNQTALKLIPSQPMANHAEALNLGGVLAKGLAASGSTDPFKTKDKIISQFKNSGVNVSLIEMSDARTYVETLLSLKSNEKQHMRSVLKKGLNLASHDNFKRHQKSMTKLMEKI